MSHFSTPVFKDDHALPRDSAEGFNWGLAVFSFGILGILLSYFSHYFPDAIFPYIMATGATVATIAALSSYFTIFNGTGRVLSVFSMAIFSVASPVLFLLTFMSFK